MRVMWRMSCEREGGTYVDESLSLVVLERTSTSLSVDWSAGAIGGLRTLRETHSPVQLGVMEGFVSTSRKLKTLSVVVFDALL